MVKYLLDTSVCISMFKNKDGIREKLQQVGLDACAVSEISIAELYYGAAKSGTQRHYRDVENVIRLFSILPVYPSLEMYGKLKVELEIKGQRVDDFDLLIGATAQYNKLTMVTSNVKHFIRIPNLVVENWNRP